MTVIMCRRVTVWQDQWKPRKCGGRATKRGLSKEQVCILISSTVFLSITFHWINCGLFTNKAPVWLFLSRFGAQFLD